MKTPEKITLFLIFIFTFFTNFNWFFDVCARRVCPDGYGPSLPISFIPNFYFPETCGGLAGLCTPAHWSLQMFSIDVILMVVLSITILPVIRQISS
jgi:hypothetical protein